MKYAVQLSDLSVKRDLSIDLLLMMIQPVLTDTVVRVKPHDIFDHVGLLLDDSDPERLMAIMRLLKRQYPNVWELRFYQSETEQGGWKPAQLAELPLFREAT